MEARAIGLAAPKVRKWVVCGGQPFRSDGFDGLRACRRRGLWRCLWDAPRIVRIRLRSAQLVHVIGEPRVADLNADFVYPGANVFQRVPRAEQFPNLWPRLTHLASLGARLFPAPARGDGRDPVRRRTCSAFDPIVPLWFRRFHRKFSNDFGIFQFWAS